MTRYGEVGRPNRQAPDFLGEHFPQAPDAIRAAYQQYWHSIQPSYQAIRAQELELKTTNTLISDFYAGYLSPQTYGAATLAPLVQAVENPELRPYALSALGTYVHETDESPNDVEFTMGVASGLSVMRHYQNDVIDALYPDSEQPWAQLPDAICPGNILRIRTELGVDIETHLISAIRSLQWFLSLDPAARSDALQRVRRAESLLAPMSEIMGFDGVSMGLHSHKSMMRLRQLGEERYIEQARADLQPLIDPDAVDKRVDSILTAALGKNSDQRQVLTHRERHGIMIGESVSTPENIRTVWRIKALGSAAHKYSISPPGAKLTDIVGATLITDDARQAGSALGQAYTAVLENSRMQLRASPKRDKALHVRGTPDFIEEVALGMGIDSLAALRRIADVPPSGPGDYHVAKLSFDYQEWGDPVPTPVEIQMNTKEGREDARVGSASHALHKLTHSPATEEQVAALAQIRQGKELLGQNGLTPQSRERARQLLHDIHTAASEKR